MLDICKTAAWNGGDCMRKTWATPAGTYWKDWLPATDGAHTLIAGTTGSGKSVLLHSLIYNLLLSAPDEVQFCLIDPKRVELCRYRKLPHVVKYCQEVPEALSALSAAVRIMDDRYRIMQKNGVVNNIFSSYYIVIDELADLMITNKREFLPLLQKIAQLGRACGVHLLCATQAPSRKVIPAELTLNFTDKICLRCDSAIESRQVIGDAGGELLPMYGEALYRHAGCVEHLRVPMTPDNDLYQRICYWQCAKPKWHLF